jgi:hypothetical protein
MEYQDFKTFKEDIQADERGRISLGAQCGNKHYRVLVKSSGEILLVPMAMIPEKEAWVFQNAEARASLERGLSQARDGKLSTVSIPSYEKFADSIPDEVEE